MSLGPTRELAAELRELTALPGPVGSEEPVAEWLLARLTHVSPSPTTDSHGNLCLAGAGASPRVLVTAHMDQVGYVVSRVDNHRAQCLPLGSPDIAATRRVPARVFGDAHPPLDAELVSFGDAGATIESGRLGDVRVGDHVVFATELDVREDGSVLGAALDDRIGCLIVLRAVHKLAGHASDVAFAWTVREEAEQSGVVRVVRDIEPQAMIGVDITYAVGTDQSMESPLTPGAGPVITLLDGGMVGHRSLIRPFQAAATSLDMRWQPEVVRDGVSEAGRVQRMFGIPSLALLVPIHNPHSHEEIAFLSDIASTIDLLVAGLREIVRPTPASRTPDAPVIVT